MAGFPQVPGMIAGPATPQGPPPSVPGLTAPQAPPPAALMQALAKRPEQATSMMKQAVMLLEQVAQLDVRQEPRIKAALRWLRGPMKPGSSENP